MTRPNPQFMECKVKFLKPSLTNHAHQTELTSNYKSDHFFTKLIIEKDQSYWPLTRCVLICQVHGRLNQTFTIVRFGFYGHPKRNLLFFEGVVTSQLHFADE